MAEYYIGQIFEETYPEEAAEWVNNNNCYIAEIEPLGDVKRYEIFKVAQPTPEEQEAEFNRQFFNTSLGYVRRKAYIQATGERKDFISDILPLLTVGTPVLTYTRDLQQNRVLVTEQFINECKQQMYNDFYGGLS